jgi:hypothetical protein
MDYPEKRETDQEVRRCPWCTQTFIGTQGVRIHLGQVAGDEYHPDDAPDQYDPPDQSRAQDDAFETTPIWGEAENDAASSDGGATPPMIQTARIYEYIIDLHTDGHTLEALWMKHRFCGSASDGTPEPRQAVFEAILREGRSSMNPVVGLGGDDDGIYIECQGAAAILDADDARWLANAIQLASEQENWRQTPRDLLVILRTGAEFLDQNPAPE